MPIEQGTPGPGSWHSAEDTTFPTTGGSTGSRCGQRGQTALARLASTAEFSHPKLPRGERVLALYCLLCLTGSTGTLGAALHELQDARAGEPSHWSHGRTLAQLRKQVCNFLGRGARRGPRWEEIDDLFAAALTADERARLQPWAAGLFVQAHHQDPPGYPGPIGQPPWAADEVVHADTIRAWIATASVPPSTPDGAVHSGGPQTTGEWGWAEFKPVLQELLRANAAAEKRASAAEAELAKCQAMLDTQWRATWNPGDTEAALWRLAEELTAKADPGLTPEQVRYRLHRRIRRSAARNLLA